GFGYGSTIETLGAALELNGSNYVNIPNNSKLDLSKTGQFTQETWIFPSINDGKKRGILGKLGQTNDPQAYPSIWQVNNTDIEVGFGDGKKYQGFTVPNVLNQSTWNHVATSFDGEKYRLYVNGVEVYADESFKGRAIAPTQELNIGKVDNSYVYSTSLKIKALSTSFSASSVKIDGYDFTVKNIQAEKQWVGPSWNRSHQNTGNYWLDIETEDEKASQILNNLRTTEPYKLFFNNGSRPSQIQSKSSVYKNSIAGDNLFTGTVDEVRIWNIARTAGEIQDSMLTPLTGEEQGLVGYWPFENNTNDASKITALGTEETDPNKAIKPANGDVKGNISPQYIDNPAPQIGYVEVNLDKPFNGEQGLWLKYNIDGGTATQETDYFNSRYR
ncbi:MAG: LamG domain-containing protein, partial [Microcoleaceae cyanobacterium]